MPIQWTINKGRVRADRRPILKENEMIAHAPKRFPPWNVATFQITAKVSNTIRKKTSWTSNR